MENTPDILLIDDDPELRSLLQQYLGKQGMNVRTLPDAGELDRRLLRQRPDLLVLDVMMPGEDGLAVCRRLRGQGDDLPIIMLTARSDDIDRIVGLELGADDYLGKPFNPRELVARIHAVLRRRVRLPPGSPDPYGEVLRFGPFRLDMGARTLFHDDERITLTSGEFSLLAALAKHPRQPMSRERLIDLARGRSAETIERSIDVQVSRLRKLIEDDASAPRYIQTVWGVGYVFIPDGGGA
ncbi:two-component system response regulator OmpR [Chitinivorax sp. PXF-14]|uniref:osmolarity response regulator transcription factor OmpR n=1 Tax=Chitinivorax sp. PXF-14 TaxID=3230488 RepID=UPI00346688C4